MRALAKPPRRAVRALASWKRTGHAHSGDEIGGTSVATLDRIRRAAKRVGREVANGHDVIVIVSAMAGETNKLVGFVEETSPLSERARIRCGGQAPGENVNRRADGADAAGNGRAGAQLAKGWQVPLKTTSAHCRGRGSRRSRLPTS